MAKTFAESTGQEVIVYYSEDGCGRGKKRRQLTGLAAEAAWHAPVKDAADLPGKVVYVPGMPVFCTENTATELGISKGSRGTLVSVRYAERDGKRYATTAEVDFPGYNGTDPEHPHRVLL
ncbi:hypothetical protein FB45DRAFT_705025, partial [Roridomyces roridus]